jgi:Transposase
MERDGSGVSALLGLDGFVVRAQLLDGPSGELVTGGGDQLGPGLVPVLRRPSGRPRPTPGRGQRSAVGGSPGRAGVGQAPVALCGAGVPDRHVVRGVRPNRSPSGLTERAWAEIARRVGPDEHSVARAARDFGVSWHAAMAAVRDHGRPRIDHLARLGAPRAVGLDETSFLAATAERPRLLVTGIVDLDTGRLIDVLPARSAVAVTDWLAAKPQPWLAGIRHVVIDPYQPYATAVARGLPGARLVGTTSM